MTKKQYFMTLWAICSVAPIAKTIQMIMKDTANLEVPMSIIMFTALLGSICINGLLLSLGMDFAKKIGIRFLFLDEYVDWGKDLFKPAIVIGSLYAGSLLLINMFIPLLVPFSLYSFISWYPIIYEAIISVLSAISEDAFGMLFVLSGIALLMNKIAKNVSMSIIMPATIVAIILVPQVVEYIWKFGMGVPLVFNAAKCRTVMDMLLVYTLCWRKSFETALLCHVVIVMILSLIVPAAVIALGV